MKLTGSLGKHQLVTVIEVSEGEQKQCVCRCLNWLQTERICRENGDGVRQGGEKVHTWHIPQAVPYSVCHFTPLSKRWLSDTVEQSVASGTVSPLCQSLRMLNTVFEEFRHEFSTIIRSDNGLKQYYNKLLVCFYWNSFWFWLLGL